MIYALNEQNERIKASDAEKGKRYLCPNVDCENRDLILKQGDIRIAHFAHKSRKECLSEPERESHILGKKQLQSLLNLGDEFVEYYGIEGVRPDILYGTYAIEVQCSHITTKEVKRRNKIYTANGYTPIWIFLEDQFMSLKRTKESHMFYRIRNSALRGSFQNVGWHNYNVFSFTSENEHTYICYRNFSKTWYDDFIKLNELVINSKDDFDNSLEDIVGLIELKKELDDLRKRLNSLPKKIQGYLYELTGLDYPHMNAWDFINGSHTIGMFLDEIFLKNEPSNMEIFKAQLEKMLIEASTRDKKLEEWKDRNTIERNGKKYIPLCGIDKIYDSTPKAYQIWDAQWIPKSRSYKDKKYLYCEEWLYKKITKRFKEE